VKEKEDGGIDEQTETFIGNKNKYNSLESKETKHEKNQCDINTMNHD